MVGTRVCISVSSPAQRLRIRPTCSPLIGCIGITWLLHSTYQRVDKTVQLQFQVCRFIGVKDLEKSLASYPDGLGLQTDGIIATKFKGAEKHPPGAVVMFELQNGFILALHPRTELAKDAQQSVGCQVQRTLVLVMWYKTKQKSMHF